MRNNNLFIFVTFLGAVLLATVYTGCKKYDNPPPVFETLKDLSQIQRKVLIIGIDGLGGAELQAIAPPNIATLQKNAKFSYKSFGGTTDAGGWASLVTGTSNEKNLISSDSFQPTLTGNDPDAGGNSYLNVFDYITQFHTLQTAIVSPWPNLRKYLINSDFSPAVNTDKAVRDSTVGLLNTQNTLGAVIVNFRDVEAAGNIGGFKASNSSYSAAVKTTDGYIGDIMKALTSRKNYNRENWLVIVTTNHGGSSTSPTKGFVLAYNPLFKPFELKQNGSSTVGFSGPAIFAAVPNDNGLYNMGTNQDFTVQMQTEFIDQGEYYPGFLGKSTLLDGGTLTGWFWMQAGTDWLLEFGGSDNGGDGKNQLALPGVLAGGWHTLTMTVQYIDQSTRTASAFVDGVFQSSYNISGNQNINTSELLQIGGAPQQTNFYAANLAIFNKALDPATVAANINLKDITKHPNYANLIGFWPINDAYGSTISNTSPVGYNMKLQGPYTWIPLGNSTASQTPVDLTYVDGAPSYISTLSDVTAMSLYWMNIKILPDYGIDGNTILDKFEIEFLK